MSRLFVDINCDPGIVFKADRVNAGKLRIVQVQHRNGVCLLAGDIGSIVCAGNVFRLQIDGRSGVLFQEDTFVHQRLTRVVTIEVVKTNRFNYKGFCIND